MGMQTFELGLLHTNCYLLHDARAAVVIDPGYEPTPLLEYLAEHGLTLTHILNTHLHFDHVMGNAALAEATGAPICGGSADEYLLAPGMDGTHFGLPATPPFDYQPLTAGEYTLAGERCLALPTPGHTPGSFSFYFPAYGSVFVGDALFYRSVGRTDLPGGDTETLLTSIREQLFTLPPETAVYPGHGIPTTVGDELAQNPYAGKAARV